MMAVVTCRTSGCQTRSMRIAKNYLAKRVAMWCFTRFYAMISMGLWSKKSLRHALMKLSLLFLSPGVARAALQ